MTTLAESLWTEERIHPKFDESLGKFVSGFDSPSSFEVTDENVLSGTAVFLAVRIISEDTAMLPLIIYESLKDGSRERANNHALFELLHNWPNDEYTSMEVREWITANAIVYGTGFGQIVRDRAGRPKELWPLETPRMTIKRKGGRLSYSYDMGNGKSRTLKRDEVLPINGWRKGGLMGLSALTQNRDALGGIYALEEYGQRFFANGANTGAVITIPGKLRDPEAIEEFRKGVRDKHATLAKSHEIMVLEEGSEYKITGISPKDSQAIEQRLFNVTEVARMTRIPPHMLMSLEHGTDKNNLGSQDIGYVQHSLGGWLKRWEQRLEKHLLMPSERKTHCIEHLVDGLLRGDVKTRWEVYQIAIQNGVMAPNEARRLENMPALPGLDEPVFLQNLVPAQDKTGEKKPNDKKPDDKSVRSAEERAIPRVNSRKQFLPLIQEATSRIVSRQVRETRKALEKFKAKDDVKGFEAWADKFFADFESVVFKTLRESTLIYARHVEGLAADEVRDRPSYETRSHEFDIEAFIDAFLGKIAYKVSQKELRNLKKLALEKWSLVSRYIDNLSDEGAAALALRQVTEVEGAVAIKVWELAGVTKTKWSTFGENCPFCTNLDGMIVSITKNFVSRGDKIEGTDASGHRIFTSSANISHPPLHGGCDCAIVPA